MEWHQSEVWTFPTRICPSPISECILSASSEFILLLSLTIILLNLLNLLNYKCRSCWGRLMSVGIHSMRDLSLKHLDVPSCLVEHRCMDDCDVSKTIMKIILFALMADKWSEYLFHWWMMLECASVFFTHCLEWWESPTVVLAPNYWTFGQCAQGTIFRACKTTITTNQSTSCQLK